MKNQQKNKNIIQLESKNYAICLALIHQSHGNAFRQALAKFSEI